MGIRASFRGDIGKAFGALLDEVERQVLETLHHAGERAVTKARLIQPPAGFTDQTANLRSSIGYGVFKDGRNVTAGAGFQVVKGGAEGARKGRGLCDSIGSKTKGYALVVVAGMSYAVYVEKGHKLPGGGMTRPRDVLTSAERVATEQASRELRDLAANVTKALR